MVGENLQILLQLYYAPMRALSSVLDRGNVVFAIVAAVLVNLALGIVLSRAPAAGPGLPPGVQAVQDDGDDGPPLPRMRMGPQQYAMGPAYRLAAEGGFSPVTAATALIPVALLFAPAIVVIVGLWDGLGGAGVLLRRDYMPMLACTMMGWTAAFIPATLLAFAGVSSGHAAEAALYATAAGQLAFVVYAICATRTVMGTGWGHAVGGVAGAFIVMGIGQTAYSLVGGGGYLFMSPFILYYLYGMVQQDVRLMSGGLSSRQSLRRHLEASTLNPRDSDAHYQLGLIYQQRRNYPEAISRFQKAVEIEPTETDAHYQLGRIAREQKRFEDARKHFAAAYAIDPKHSSNEVLRDLGIADYELGRVEQALGELEPFIDRREYDAEGLYFLGMTLKKLGRAQEAREMFARSVEAAKTAPAHRRRVTGVWGRAAGAELRNSK